MLHTTVDYVDASTYFDEFDIEYADQQEFMKNFGVVDIKIELPLMNRHKFYKMLREFVSTLPDNKTMLDELDDIHYSLIDDRIRYVNLA